MPVSECIEKWPVADFSRCTSLKEHLENVTAFSHYMFSERLALKSFEKAGVNAEAILALASAFHDIAKASNYYANKGNFALHEHVSALLLYEASKTCKNNIRPTFIVASKAIARHHSAMEGRRPMDIVKSSRIKELVDALLMLNKNYVEKAFSWNKKLTNLAIRILEPSLNSLKYHELAHILSYLSSIGNIPNIEKGTETRLIWTVTGYLIVSDILVAAYERKEQASEDTDKLVAYARYWLNELNLQNLDNVGRVLAKARAQNRYKSLVFDVLKECL